MKDVGGRGDGDPTGALRDGAVDEIFSRMRDLGGWLVVSFIAPVPAAGSGRRRGRRVSNFDALSESARKRDEEDIRKQREKLEEVTKALNALTSQLAPKEPTAL